MESIQGLVEHIVYHNDTNGYTVFSMMCQGEEIVSRQKVNILNIRYMDASSKSVQ